MKGSLRDELIGGYRTLTVRARITDEGDALTRLTVRAKETDILSLIASGCTFIGHSSILLVFSKK